MVLIDRLREIVRSQHLLDHPFYQRWSCGELGLDELREYARQYYHYALAFPTFLSAAHANSDDLSVRQEILENLIEEERGPENHPELWLRFCEALGLERHDVMGSTPSEATRRLIDTIKVRASSSVHEGLAALYAYESQVPAVAQAKIDGLARFYSIADERSVSFFTVHLAADVEHARTSESLLKRLCTGDAEARAASEAAEATVDALYGFLDGVMARPAAA